MRKLVWCMAVLVLGCSAWAQLEDARDMAFGNKPFNPTDEGQVMWAMLRDNDAGNRDPVIFTRIEVTNLGTARAEDLEWIEVRLEVGGQRVVLTRGTQFPIVEVLLPRPVEERQIPDDGEGSLTVWIKASGRISDGRTVQPKIRLWWSEGGEGGTFELVDAAPEVFVVDKSLEARGLPGPEGGYLNPGDTFLVAEAEVWDTPDVNNHALYVVAVRVDGPKDLIWTVDINNGVTRLEVPAGVDFRLPEPAFVAWDTYDEVRPGPVRVLVTVPPTFLPKDPLTVTPALKVTVREGRTGPQEKTFAFTDPIADTVVAAGLEKVEVAVPDAGRVFTANPRTLNYSTLNLADQDRNATPVRLDTLELVPLGTITTQIQSLEVLDGRGNYVGFANALSIPLLAPDGKPILLLDDRSTSFNIALYLAEKLPLGGSLLLQHKVAVEEVLPREFLVAPGTDTKFKGVQSVTPAKAIFFGQPKITLSAVGTNVEISTDGETVGTLAGTLKHTPGAGVSPALVSAKLIAESPYRIAEEKLTRETGELAFRVETGKTTARAGKLVSAAFELVPTRFLEPTVSVGVELRVSRFVDWAGIDLPYTVSPSRVTLTFTMPKLELKADKNKVELSVDKPLRSLTGVWKFNPEDQLELWEALALEGYKVTVLDTQPGAITFKVELVPGATAASGVLLTTTFGAPEERKAALTLEVLEVIDAAGKKSPWALKEDTVELTVGPVKVALQVQQNVIDLLVDQPLARLTGVWKFAPAAELRLTFLRTADGYTAQILEAQPGAITFSVELVEGAATSGLLLSTLFGARAETKVQVELEVLEVVYRSGIPVSWVVLGSPVEVVAKP